MNRLHVTREQLNREDHGDYLLFLEFIAGEAEGQEMKAAETSLQRR